MNTITVTKRDLGKKPRQLRRLGQTPGAAYGTSLPESIPLQMAQADADRLLRSKAVGSKTTLELEGKSLPVLIKNIDRDTVSGQVEHIGFQVLEADKRAKSVARVVLLEREMVAGFINQTLFEIPYSALPADIVDTVAIDMSKLLAGDSITLGDLELAKNDLLELHLPLDTPVLNITDPKRPSAAAPADAPAEEPAQA